MVHEHIYVTAILMFFSFILYMNAKIISKYYITAIYLLLIWMYICYKT